ncbi:MAG: gliding motility-associated C-terminal domain-containing protein, partial [Lewinella sp.]|nr:gliding motility-associated C-terminal domain-containing protein [Lewinella sp.]
GNIVPADGLTVTVDQPGDYVLTITTTGIGCMADSTITVGIDENVPVADAGEDLLIECGETSMLDGTATTMGPDFVYTWSVVDGADLSGDLTSLTPMVTGAGTYLLVASNTVNGCEDTDTVMVELMLPPLAMAGDDQQLCGDGATLSANLPAGTDGQWTAGNSAAFADATDAGTGVSNLAQGQNVLTWTLSAPGCPDYSSDEVIITLAGTPVANDDLLTLAEGAVTGSVDVVENDQLNGNPNWAITVVSGPAFGTFDSLTFVNDGILDYTVGPASTGLTQLVYEICSTDCPDLCATATVNINVEGDGNIFVPNTITPNGDGANDELIFDILIITPEDEAPDNELIVFSRWGDIVYHAKPYNNDWRGTNDNGDDLPEGTYYYVLRVNIAEGVILEGDITIIR